MGYIGWYFVNLLIMYICLENKVERVWPLLLIAVTWTLKAIANNSNTLLTFLDSD